MICNELFEEGASAVDTIVVPFRVLRVVLSSGNLSLRVWNIHNFGISAMEKKKAVGILHQDINDSEAAPGSTIVIVCGDWNFMTAGDEKYYYENPNLKTMATKKDGEKETREDGWSDALRRMIDIDGKTPTHYCAAHGFASRIDRVYIGLPAWVMPCLATKAAVCADPRDWSM